MITILLSVVAALAFFAWGIAVLSAIRIVGLAPKGQKLSTYGKLGWWQFGEIRTALGAAAEPHIRSYHRAFVTFLGLILVAMIAGTLLGAAAQN